ncbi:TadE family type IV pilus minor pilin [Serinibacter arcticus]|uniref:TadE family type IV pilus minor pilin n=1 Tax=Serinibacter arcticus TaxID=1655435 RepID=UPI0018EE93F1|nr:TadE family type IV pilus minor pilin [Serinibacter arcticus]
MSGATVGLRPVDPAAADAGRSGAARERRGRAPELDRGRERGSATAELAVVLPAIVVVLLVLLLAASAGTAALACADAARVGARSASLGLSAGEVRADATRVAGEGARIAVTEDGEWVHVTVTRDVRLGGSAIGGTVTVSGQASARREPGT